MMMRTFSLQVLQIGLLFLIGTCAAHDSNKGQLASLQESLIGALTALGKTAQEPHPELGIEKPFDPLPAVAPLRYTNEGDLLKLRLLLNNVTLKGLSSLAVQEVSFAFANSNYQEEEFHEKTSIETSNVEGINTKKDIYEEEDETPHSEESNPLEDMYDYYYYEPNTNSATKYESPDSDKVEYEYEEDENLYDSEDVDSFNQEQDSYSPRIKRSENSNREHNSRHRNGRHSRKKKSKKHHENDKKDTKFFNKSETGHGGYEVKFLNYEFPFKHSPAIKDKPNQRRHKSRKESPKTHSEGSIQRSYPKPFPLKAKVRISFSNLQIFSQYIVKGSAGGVFTFKEQGKLILTIPNIFLTSTFNATLTPDYSGLRHWKSGRNHVRVQKVKSRMSIETPQLKLIPASRPPEWVRRQVQQKMEELGDGVGRRDGAIRLLLRHWARILRKLVTRAAKDSSTI